MGILLRKSLSLVTGTLSFFNRHNAVRLISITSIWILPPLFTGCEPLDIQGDSAPETQDCQTCHASPPPTGAHLYHLNVQSYRSQIACDECHSSVIRKLHWETKVKREFYRILMGFHAIIPIDGQTIKLISPWTYIEDRSTCNTKVENDKMMAARTDSLTKPAVLGIRARDSLHTTNTQIEVFPIDTIYYDKDSVQIKRYGKPIQFDKCRYGVFRDSVYPRVIGDFDSLYMQLTDKNQLTRSPDGALLYFYKTYNKYIDTSLYTLRKPETTFLNELPKSHRENYTTRLNSEDLWILEAANGSLFQLKNDTLFMLTKDSTILFDNDFAEVTGLHADGKVDIQFKHEKYTYYREEILDISRHPITGEIEFIDLGSIGAWHPQEKSCWGGGIPNALCHDQTEHKTYWYSNPPRNYGTSPALPDEE